jgi:hypothetical protein
MTTTLLPILTTPASTRMEALLPPLPTPPRPQNHQNRHPQTMALVPRTKPTIWRRGLSPTRPNTDHNPRFRASCMGSSREARRRLLLPSAIHHGRRTSLRWNERSYGAVCFVLETVEKAAA